MPIPTARLLLTAAIILAGTCGDAAAVPNEHVQIRVFNPARVPERDLLRAEREIARIFSGAGIDIRWAEGTLDGNASSLVDFSPDNWSPTGCKVASHAGELRVRLVPHAPDLASHGVLGYSLPCAAYGLDSTIFINNCEGVAREANASFPKVLAYAVAHELGHVLLRSGEHTETGLMRAHWDKAAWLRAAVEGIPIEEEHARRMRAKLSRMDRIFAQQDNRQDTRQDTK